MITVYLLRRSGERQKDKERLLREAFFADYGVSIERFDFYYGPKGKPYLKGLPYFNLSDSYDYIACVTSQQEIGIDIQRIRKVPDCLMRRYLKSSARTPEQQTLRWTQYESYAKMLGHGIPLEDSDYKNGCFLSACLPEGYVVTVCTKEPVIGGLQILSVGNG